MNGHMIEVHMTYFQKDLLRIMKLTTCIVF